MRGKLAWWLALGVAGAELAARAAEGPNNAATGLVARLHFGGTAALAGMGANTARLQQFANLPAAAELEAQTESKLATAPFRFLQAKAKLPAGAADHADLLQPLARDLIHQESELEIWGTGADNVPDLVLAVRLDDRQAMVWRTNLARVITDWTGGIPVTPVQVEGAEGWELKKHHRPDLIRLVRVAGWSVFAWGQDAIPGQNAMVQRLRKQGRPGQGGDEAWISGWVEGRTLGAHLPAWLPLDPATPTPSLSFSADPQADYLRTKATLRFPQTLQIKRSRWLVPTNLVGEPLVGFTAWRGAQPWLQRLPKYAAWQVGPVPDQVFAWAVNRSVFDTTIAVPMPQATNVLQKLGARLLNEINPLLQAHSVGELQWTTNHHTLTWSRVGPIIQPFLTATAGTNGDYLVAGPLFTPHHRAAPPAEMLGQLHAGTNLVYYDWEITAERLKFWHNCQILYSMASRSGFALGLAAEKWLDTVGTNLDNTVTQVSVQGANELSFVRKSPLGLTAMELTLAARYLDAPGFPFDAAAPSTLKPRPLMGAPKTGGTNPGAVPATPTPTPSPGKPK